MWVYINAGTVSLHLMGLDMLIHLYWVVVLNEYELSRENCTSACCCCYLFSVIYLISFLFTLWIVSWTQNQVGSVLHLLLSYLQFEDWKSIVPPCNSHYTSLNFFCCFICLVSLDCVEHRFGSGDDHWPSQVGR